HDMGEIVAAACLAHDLGNPPFGHSGEKTIGAFFTEGRGLALRKHLTDDEWNDLTHFEGNANSFRALVHQFKGRRPGGFAMTYSTLASIVKYPYSSSQAGDKGKFGFFCSEKDSYECIAAELGIKRKPDGRYCRHPLVYLVEAADDICYQIMDIEDGHKLKLISTEETSALMLSLHDDDQHDHMREIMALVADPNEKIAYLRSAAVGLLVKECVRAFVNHEQEILSGTFQGSLIDNISPRVAEGYQRISKVAREKLYRASYVVDVDLSGSRIITLLLEKLIDAVMHPERNYSQLLLAKFPQQYDVNAPSVYNRIQAVLDHISAMTDTYALNLYRQLDGISIPSV
ncbi:MAG: dNTP triphosphohydrolase, partial [Muribaculaceae bacterium]|nr:dNTP triphosphohydrolase [Muribaculaceae bacterium]